MASEQEEVYGPMGGPTALPLSIPRSVIGMRKQNMAAIVNSLSNRQRQQMSGGDEPPASQVFTGPASAGASDEDGGSSLEGIPAYSSLQGPTLLNGGAEIEESSGGSSPTEVDEGQLSPGGTENSRGSGASEGRFVTPGGPGSNGAEVPMPGTVYPPINGKAQFPATPGSVKRESMDSPDIADMFYTEDESDIAISDNTLKANQQAVKMFKDCLSSRGMSVDLTTYTKEELAAALKFFYSGLRKRDGGCYKMNTLHVFRSGINRHLANVDIVNDAIFKDANQVFHSQIAEARRTRRDTAEHSPLLSEEDFNRIYNGVVFDLSNPKTLQWKVFFDTMLYLHRRGDNVKMMTRDTFSLVNDERRYVTYVPPTNDGNRMYEIPGDPLCPVKSYEKYISKLQPESPWLWQKPKRSFIPSDPCWYELQPLMFHRPYQLISAICKYAGLSRQYSPQSILVPGAIFIRKRQPGGTGMLPMPHTPSGPGGAPSQPLVPPRQWAPFVPGGEGTGSPDMPTGRALMLPPPPTTSAPSYPLNGQGQHLPISAAQLPQRNGVDLAPGVDFHPAKYRRLNKGDMVPVSAAVSGQVPSNGTVSHLQVGVVGGYSVAGDSRPEQPLVEAAVSAGSQSSPGGMPPLAACIQHYIREGSLFCCEHCNILFLERSTMFLHKGLHGTEQKWQCSVCKQTCSNRNEFTLHIINNLHRK